MTKRIKHKFNAIRTEVNNIKFGSKKEARYYQDLLLRQKAGEVLFFNRQVGFDLVGGVRYFVDFVVYLEDGTVEFIDVKGVATAMYRLKKKQVESLYPIKIIEC